MRALRQMQLRQQREWYRLRQMHVMRQIAVQLCNAFRTAAVCERLIERRRRFECECGKVRLRLMVWRWRRCVERRIAECATSRDWLMEGGLVRHTRTRRAELRSSAALLSAPLPLTRVRSTSPRKDRHGGVIHTILTQAGQRVETRASSRRARLH